LESLFFGAIGAYFFSQAVLLAKAGKNGAAWKSACVACLTVVIQAITSENSSLEQTLWTLTGSIGLSWLGIRFGQLLFKRSSLK
jgi:hypothetical protein